MRYPNESKDERDAWRTVFRVYRTSCWLKRKTALEQLIAIIERDERDRKCSRKKSIC